MSDTGPLTRAPPNLVSPADGAISPAMHFSSVVLPHPEGPTTVTNSRSATSKPTSPIATDDRSRPTKVLASAWTSSAMPGWPGLPVATGVASSFTGSTSTASDVESAQVEVPPQDAPLCEAEDRVRGDPEQCEHEDPGPHARYVVALLGVQDEPADPVAAAELLGEHQQQHGERDADPQPGEDPRAHRRQDDLEQALPEAEPVGMRRLEDR